jgi:hypothetical protein
MIGETSLQVYSVIGIPEDRTREFLKTLAAFARANHTQLEHTPYILVLTGPVKDGKKVKVKDIQFSCGTGRSVFFVDETLRLEKTEVGEAKISSCSMLSEQRGLFAALVADTYIYKMLSGKTIGELDVEMASRNPLAGSKWHRSIAEFDGLLLDHYHIIIRDEQGLRYWHDKNARILLCGKNGTEEIFHRSLFWWLNNYVSDKLKVYAQPKGVGQDETDIIVVTVGGSYLIEIKWLGKNQKGTIYDQDQINVGLAQVYIYLDNDPKCICGNLVVYDGRPEDEHNTKSAHNDTLRHARCATPNIVFLESEPPSKKALKIALQSNK